MLVDTIVVTKYFETNRDIVKAYFSYLEKSMHLVGSKISAEESRDYLVKLLESSRDVTLEALESHGNYIGSLFDKPQNLRIPENEPISPIQPEQPFLTTAQEQVAISEEQVLKDEDYAGWIKSELSELTGFPDETMGRDTRLEEDLGINSIDRVDIITKITQKFPCMENERSVMGCYETIGDIEDHITGVLTKKKDNAPVGEDACKDGCKEADEGEISIENIQDKDVIKRFVFTEETLKDIADDLSDVPYSHVFLVGETSEKFEFLLTELKNRGISLNTLYLKDKKWHRDALPDSIDIEDISGLNKMLSEVIRKDKTSLTILYLADGDENPLDTGERQLWERQLEHAPVGLFALIQAMFSGSGKTYRDIMIGIVGYEGSSPAWYGARGVARSLAHDLPEVKIRSVWIKEHLIEKSVKCMPDVLHKLPKGQDFYLDGDRMLYKNIVHRELDKTAAPLVKADSRSIFLLTGGGDGITAQCGQMLAEKFRCRIIALGRTPMPSGKPYSDITDDETLKRQIVKDISDKAGRPLTGEEIENQKRLILRQRSIWDTAEKIRSFGASFDYYTVDVTDYAALASVINLIHKEHGLINGLIHGSGIVGQKREKTVDSFRKVLYTKAASAFYLYQLLKNDPLQFAVMFSSIASYTGGPNLCDYSAANEILNEIAHDWNRRVDYPVKSFLWSFWSDTGLAKSMAGSSLVGIRSSDGVRMLLEEVLYGDKAEDKVVYINESVLEYSINPAMDSLTQSSAASA